VSVRAVPPRCLLARSSDTKFCRHSAHCTLYLAEIGAKLLWELMMLRLTLTAACVVAFLSSASAQKAEIEAVNAQWVVFFNRGDFTGIASLYTEDATALPPGSTMVTGRDAIGAMWKNIAGQVSDPKVITLDVKPLGPSAAREIGTFSLKKKDPTSQELTGKYLVVWEKVGNDWKLAADIWNDGN
jgi:uncharacterized protein (TIGR02246 family)